MKDVILKAVLNKVAVWKQMYENHDPTADEINDRNWLGMCGVLNDRILELEAQLKYDHKEYKRLRGEKDKRIKEFETAIYDLQMADPHLEFISRVQDAGLHHEWDNFTGLLKSMEKAGRVPPDYESVELDFEPDEPSEFGIFYKGGQLSMDEIVLRLNRLSEIERIMEGEDIDTE